MVCLISRIMNTRRETHSDKKDLVLIFKTGPPVKFLTLINFQDHKMLMLNTHHGTLCVDRDNQLVK